MDIQEIQEHIRKLKCEETSWQSVEKLAALCTVRDELEEKEPVAPEKKSPAVAEYSYAADPQSDFIRAASAAPFDEMIRVLDAHMSGIKIVYPKEYQLVMRKLNNLTVI